MADLSITPANVVRGTNSTTISGIAGQTITAGAVVYLSPSTNQYLLAQANASSTNTVSGVALNNCSLNQPIQILSGGDYVCGGTPVVGQSYYLAADNAGAIAPVSDLTTGNYVSFLGIATSNTNIFIQVLNSGTAHA